MNLQGDERLKWTDTLPTYDNNLIGSNDRHAQALEININMNTHESFMLKTVVGKLLHTSLHCLQGIKTKHDIFSCWNAYNSWQTWSNDMSGPNMKGSLSHMHICKTDKLASQNTFYCSRHGSMQLHFSWKEKKLIHMMKACLIKPIQSTNVSLNTWARPRVKEMLLVFTQRTPLPYYQCLPGFMSANCKILDWKCVWAIMISWAMDAPVSNNNEVSRPAGEIHYRHSCFNALLSGNTEASSAPFIMKMMLTFSCLF